MDGLSGAASIIAVIDISAKIASLCLQYSTAVKAAKDDVERVQGKLDDITHILKQIKQLLKRQDKTALPTTRGLSGSLGKCLKELKDLQAKLERGTARKTMSRFGLRALKWPFTSKEVDKIVANLEQYVQTFDSALQIDQTAFVMNIDQKLDWDKLSIAKGASYDSHLQEHNAHCLEDTRTTLRRDILSWAQDKNGKSVFWLSGMAGTGKSTIARTIAESLAINGQLGASFFFKKGEGECGNASRFFTTIAADLAVREPGVVPGIRRALHEEPNISNKTLKDQFEKLVLQPILGMEPSSHALARVIVIDALDECEREEDIRTILQLLARTKDIRPVPLRILVTSRPEFQIRLGFKEMPDGTYQDLVLHEVPRSTIEHDIRVFLEYKLGVIREERNLSSEWPAQQQILMLVKLAVPLFIYAATVCRYVGSKGSNPPAYLMKVLEYQKTSFSQLDRTYLPVLDQLLSEQEEDEEMWLQTFREIVGSIVILQSPLSTFSLSRLLRIPEEEIQCLLDSLHSVLNVPANEDAPVRLLHLSFREFLTNPQKQGKIPYWVDEKETHRKLADRCLEVMSGPSGLHQDMCSLPGPGTLRSEIDEGRIASRLSHHLMYACRYWIDHVKQGQQEIVNGDTAHIFLQKHFLHWLEAMSLMNESSRCIKLLTSLQTLVNPSEDSVLAFLHEAKRFVMRYHFVLANAPLQVYCSAILFAPEKSLIKQTFMNQMLVECEILSEKELDWDACYSTLEGHTDTVTAVAFSPDGQLIVSASRDTTLRLWEADTGWLRSTLEGHNSPVKNVIFSPDGQVLASLCGEKVRLWNVATGLCFHTLERHLPNGLCCDSSKSSFSPIITLAFLLDGKLIGSACKKTIRLWDVKTGICRSSIERHDSGLPTAFSLDGNIAFSPDGKLVVCGSRNTVQILETDTGRSCRTFKGHSDLVISVAISPNAQLVASACLDNKVCLWEVDTGTCRTVFEGSRWIKKLVFSPNGQLVALVSENSMQLGEVETGKYRFTMKEDSRPIRNIAFSPDGRLIVLTSNETVETATGMCYNTFEGHSFSIEAVVFSPDGQLVASASSDQTVRLWEVRKGTYRRTVGTGSRLPTHDWVSGLALSPDEQTIASLSFYGKVQLWDVETGTRHSTLRTSDRLVDLQTSETYIHFSPDGRVLHTHAVALLVPAIRTVKTSPTPQNPLSQFRLEDHWIMRNEQRFLWLPPEYRTSVSRTCGDVVCLGLKSGLVAFFENSVASCL